MKLRPALAVLLLIVLSPAPDGWNMTPAASAQDQPQHTSQAAPVMPIDEVRIGMKGYGLTVFHGTKIEPFPVEVVSVISDSSPGRGTIWIRCDDPRLEHSGPVQGMSGSPIYLWEDGETGELGEGGRLIGAFAFGYAMVKECLAGVQPIDLMRDVGTRALDTLGDEATGPSSSSMLRTRQTLDQLKVLASQRGVSPHRRFQLDLIDLAMQQVAAAHGMGSAASQDASPPLPAAPGIGAGGRVTRMMLPMAVGSPELASFVTPLLEPLGLAPFADAAGSVSGPPPAGIDPASVELAAGSVLSIPLAYGDIDLSAAGTVTEVLPDGTVLGFGHPMFGQGETALPMATGYVHFVAPLITISFKQTGSLQIQGTVVEDASAGIAGIEETRYQVAPVTVDLQMPGVPDERFQYQVVDHPMLTPILSVLVAAQSLTAEQDLPIENTLHVKGELAFTGGRTLPVDAILPGAQAMDLFFELAPPISVLMNNPHENLKLESMTLSVRVEPVLKIGSLTHARVNQAIVAPGEHIEVAATVQPYGHVPKTYHARLKVPAWLKEGDYQMMVCDATTYARIIMTNRPHLAATRSVDDLVAVLRKTMSIRRDALYLVLQLPEQGLAVGRSEMPRLPSSRKAMIATPTSTLAVPFMETAEASIATDVVVQGQMGFTVAVREKPMTQSAAPSN